nr:MAG TPA: hypothetical protein [Caudoviricetes sp.]
MDNIKLITLLSDYGIFCLERQKNVLTAYRKMRREYWELAIIILATLASIACAIASVVYAALGLFEVWAAVLTFILGCVLTSMFVIYAVATVDSIRTKKTFIAEANSIPTTLEDIIYIVNSLNEDDTEEDEQ